MKFLKNKKVLTVLIIGALVGGTIWYLKKRKSKKPQVKVASTTKKKVETKPQRRKLSAPAPAYMKGIGRVTPVRTVDGGITNFEYMKVLSPQETLDYNVVQSYQKQADNMRIMIRNLPNLGANEAKRASMTKDLEKIKAQIASKGYYYHVESNGQSTIMKS